jgi:hypothetical protein
LEEPENGMHPSRIPAMLRLLQDLAVEADEAVSPANPLRQVLINTHSPSVVAEVPDHTLLMAKLVPGSEDTEQAILLPLQGTWRTAGADDVRTVAKGDLLAYLNPIGPREPPPTLSDGRHGQTGPVKRRVKDRPDLQTLLPFDEPMHAAE